MNDELYELRINGMSEESARRWITFSVTDVPELVRYDKSDICLAIENGYDPLPSEEGEYVRYDQAAAMLVAKDSSYNKLEASWLNAEGKITELEAELAQIKVQKPVGKNCIISVQKHLSDAGYKIPLKHIDDAIAKHYAAPVDKTAEIERLRQALNDISELTRATLIVDTAGSAVNRCNLAIDIARTALKPSEPQS